MKDLSFKNYLIEMPVPADWDKEKLGGRNSFASQIRYAKERAKQIGTGSSRVAFVVPYEGRQTVLKIAKNKKGLSQNEHEAGMFSDYYLKGLGVTIPMIDYDEDSITPSWIHTEFAAKAKPSDFIRATGLALHDLIRYAMMGCGKERPNGDQEKAWYQEWQEKLDENELASGLIDLLGSYDIPVNDFKAIGNWGIYDGGPVIIDLGLSHDIMTSLYSRKPQNRW
jgi:hypothetical protein